MPRPWRIRFSGAKYHATSRGNGGQRIFLSGADYERFLVQLADALERDEVILYAYVLMSNHFHLFVETPHGNVQRFMQRLNTAYSMYFRLKHGRPGHCLQGRYKARLVHGDEYVVRLTRYIHLNPVKTDAMKRKSLPERRGVLRRWRWSSYLGYVDGAHAEEVIDYRWLRLLGRKTLRGNRHAYEAYAAAMVATDDEWMQEAMSRSRYAMGDEKFVEDVESELREMRLNRSCYGDVDLPEGPSLGFGQIERVVAADFSIEPGVLHSHGREAGDAKAVAIELCCAFSGQSQRAIASHFGYKTDAGVSRQRRVLRERLKSDRELKSALSRLKRRLGREVSGKV